MTERYSRFALTFYSPLHFCGHNGQPSYYMYVDEKNQLKNGYVRCGMRRTAKRTAIVLVVPGRFFSPETKKGPYVFQNSFCPFFGFANAQGLRRLGIDLGKLCDRRPN